MDIWIDLQLGAKIRISAGTSGKRDKRLQACAGRITSLTSCLHASSSFGTKSIKWKKIPYTRVH